MIHGGPSRFDIDASAISAGFRSSLFHWNPGLGWQRRQDDDLVVRVGNEIEGTFRAFGYNGYLNEENEYCDDCDWKKLFWGMKKYNKLLTVKQYWDPKNVFWCIHCVGSDLGK